jgi:hypothetical protein
MNRADVVSLARWHRSVGRISEDDGVNLVRILVVVGGRGAGGTRSAGVAGDEIYMSGVTQGIEDQRERTKGDNGSKQDSSGAERLTADDIKAGSGESGNSGGERLLHRWSSSAPGRAGSEQVRRGSPHW